MDNTNKTSSNSPFHQWAQRREKQAHRKQVERIENAKKVWRSFGDTLGTKRQLQLIAEIIETRGPEIRKAYPDVVGIAEGYKFKNNRIGSKKLPILCFIVRKKFSGESKDPPKEIPNDRRIPDYILTYITLKRKRQLCAIPTDVECHSTAYKNVQPQSERFVRVDPRNGGKSAMGTLTCAVRIRRGNGDLLPHIYALSCLHVLALAQEKYPDIAYNAKVSLRSSGKRIGRLAKYRGFIDPHYTYSFDAAFAQIDKAAINNLKKALPERLPKLFIRKIEDTPDNYLILIPNGDAIEAEKLRIHHGSDFPIFYKDSSGHPNLEVWHDTIIESLADTHEGQSGSPVVTRDYKKLVGMHIAGLGKRAFMIPAKFLFDPMNYYGLSKNARIRIHKNLT